MSAPEAAESSRTNQEAEPEPEPQRKWLALLSAPVILDDDDDDRDMLLELDDPPRPSRLLLRNRYAHDPRRRRGTDEPPSAYILAVAADRSARVLVQFGEGGIICLFDADVNSRTVTRLPPVPSSLRSKSLDISPERSIGIIAFVDPDDHDVVYFFQGSKLFGLDLRKRQVVAYEEHEHYLMDGDRRHMFHLPIVDAWELSPLKQRPMEHTFPRGTHIRVRVSEFQETDGFVEATEDGRKVVVSTWRIMPQSAWIVDYIKRQGRTWTLLPSSAYGRYLASQEAMEPEEYYDGLRLITHFRANDEGNFNEGYGDCFHFHGRSVPKLWTEVMQRQMLSLDTQAGLPQAQCWAHLGLRQPDGKDVLCVRPGSYGRLTPLITDLPRSVERLEIVVLANGSPAVDSLRYPSLDESEA